MIFLSQSLWAGSILGSYYNATKLNPNSTIVQKELARQGLLREISGLAQKVVGHEEAVARGISLGRISNFEEIKSLLLLNYDKYLREFPSALDELFLVLERSGMHIRGTTIGGVLAATFIAGGTALFSRNAMASEESAAIKARMETPLVGGSLDDLAREELGGDTRKSLPDAASGSPSPGLNSR
jgi:hypothetical protein